jgi:Spy/CpxP family protein refolding chaperone
VTVISGSRPSVRLLTAIVLIGTFVLGAATGAGFMRWALMDGSSERLPGPPFGPWPLHQLDLSEEQRTRVHEIMERHRPELDAILRESFPQVRTIHEQIDREIREVLSDEQRTELEALEARWPFPPRGPMPPRGAGSADAWPPPPGSSGSPDVPPR